VGHPRRTLIRIICSVAVAVGVVACGSNSPTAPSSPTVTVPPAPTVTGIWDVTAVEAAVNGTLTLNQSSGSVSGTLQVQGISGSGSLNGTISADGQMSLTGSDPSGAQALLQATVDAARRSFTGSLSITQSGETGSATIRGTKR
jgi:hypothetical protein